VVTPLSDEDIFPLCLGKYNDRVEAIITPAGLKYVAGIFARPRP
jgi:hypothetical protein